MFGLYLVEVVDLVTNLSILGPNIPGYPWLLPLAVYLTIISFLHWFLLGVPL